MSKHLHLNGEKLMNLGFKYEYPELTRESMLEVRPPFIRLFGLNDKPIFLFHTFRLFLRYWRIIDDETSSQND